MNVLGRAGLACNAVSVLLLAATAALGPSAVEFDLGPHAGKGPPWFVSAGPPPSLVEAMVVGAVVVGGVGMWLVLRAARRGWSPSPRRLLAGGAIAALALLAVPTTTSTDVVDYAAYGRIAVLDHSPYVDTPATLARTGDPIGAAAYRVKFYRHVPTVYGPVATAAEWVAAVFGGASVRRVVWWLAFEAALAFVVTGALVYRLAGVATAAKVRSQLLWSANPLLLMQLVGAAHTDVIAIAFGVAALVSLRRPLVSGAAALAAAATKATAVVFALAIAWAERRSIRALASTVVGALAVAVPAYALAGPGTFKTVLTRLGGITAGNPWEPVYTMLQHHTSCAWLTTWSRRYRRFRPWCSCWCSPGGFLPPRPETGAPSRSVPPWRSRSPGPSPAPTTCPGTTRCCGR